MGILDVLANPAQLKVPDPMSGYGDMLQNALALDKLNTSRRGRLDIEESNALAKQFYGPKGLDIAKAREAYVNANKAHLLPGLEEEYAKRVKLESEAGENQANARQQDAAAQKAKAEARDKMVTMLPTLLKGARTIDDVKNTLFQYAQDPMFVESLGGLDNAKAFVQNIAAEAKGAEASGAFPQWLFQYQTDPKTATERDTFKEDLGDKSRVSSVNKYGPTAGVPRVETTANKGIDPNRAQTIINNNIGGNKYRDTIEEGKAKAFLEEEAAAKAAGGILEGIAEARSLVDRAYTGMGSGAKQLVNKGFNVVGINDAAGDDARVATELLNTYLSTAMLKNITTLRQQGLTLGAVSNVEFAELQKTIPTANSDPKTIKAWLDKYENITRRVVDAYNKSVNRDGSAPATSRTIGNMGIKPVTVDGNKGSAQAIMGSNGQPVPPKAIDILRAQPGTRALFEKRFGKAAADQVLGGGTQPGARPFPE